MIEIELNGATHGVAENQTLHDVSRDGLPVAAHRVLLGTVRRATCAPRRTGRGGLRRAARPGLPA
jgi:hypothetical protein